VLHVQAPLSLQAQGGLDGPTELGATARWLPGEQHTQLRSGSVTTQKGVC